MKQTKTTPSNNSNAPANLAATLRRDLLDTIKSHLPMQHLGKRAINKQTPHHRTIRSTVRCITFSYCISSLYKHPKPSISTKQISTVRMSVSPRSRRELLPFGCDRPTTPQGRGASSLPDTLKGGIVVGAGLELDLGFFCRHTWGIKHCKTEIISWIMDSNLVII
jgi:hypothetical protein